MAVHVVTKIGEHGAPNIAGHGKTSRLEEFIIVGLVIWIMYSIFSQAYVIACSVRP
jgi:hypothetical protein